MPFDLFLEKPEVDAEIEGYFKSSDVKNAVQCILKNAPLSDKNNAVIFLSALFNWVRENCDPQAGNTNKPLFLTVFKELLAQIKKIKAEPVESFCLGRIKHFGRMILTASAEGLDTEINLELMALAIEHSGKNQNEIIQYLTSIENEEVSTFFSKNISKILDKLSETAKKDVIKKLLEMADQQFNLKMIFAIQQYSSSRQLTDIPITQEIAEKAKTIGELNDTDSAYIQQNMAEFAYGFGKVTKTGGLLTSAQVAYNQEKFNKPYHFNPTVIHTSELKKYLSILKNAGKPVRERVAIQDNHWKAFDIKINQEGQVSILLMDSFNVNVEKDLVLKELIANFPGATIYYPSIKRQRTDLGCSIFSLNDLRHFFTAEQYFTNGIDLHDYLSQTKRIQTKTIDNTQVVSCQLPLAFELSLQHRSLIDTTLPNRQEEAKLSMNKKKEDAVTAANKHFHNKMNLRIDHKLKQMAKKNFAFMVEMSKLAKKSGMSLETYMSTKMKPFTLEGYEKRATSKVEEKLTPVANVSELKKSGIR